MLIRIIVVVLLTVAILGGALYGLTHQYKVSSAAMAPTVKDGDRVAVFRFWDTFSSPHRKDVVVLTAPASAPPGCRGKLVRRIIGLPGETVSEQTGQVLIDGKPLKEQYVKAANRDTQTAAWHVPPGQYFVLGDNRRASCDSRRFGSVPSKAIAGRVILTYWPLDRVSRG